MATVTQLPSGSYRAQVYVRGARKSKAFRTKREAIAWAGSVETDLRARSGLSEREKHTLSELIDRFVNERLPDRRGARWEGIRLNAMRSYAFFPVSSAVGSVGKNELTEYRRRRSEQVKPGSVLRELSLLSSLFSFARDELGWISDNPVSSITKPSRPKHREALYTYGEIRRLLKAMCYSPGGRIASVTGSVSVAFMFAMRSGLREGELCGLRWSDIFDDHCHVSSKTDAGNRNVPITDKARRLLGKMAGFDPELVFGIKKQSLDAMFRKYRVRAGVDGFTFHDTRHTAATWFVRTGSVNVLELCKIMGWTDPKMAMIYFNPTPKDLKRRLETRRT